LDVAVVSPVVNSAVYGVLPTSSQYLTAPETGCQANVALPPASVLPAAGEVICATQTIPQDDAA
jgi:hypothetical protein